MLRKQCWIRPSWFQEETLLGSHRSKMVRWNFRAVTGFFYHCSGWNFIPKIPVLRVPSSSIAARFQRQRVETPTARSEQSPQEVCPNAHWFLELPWVEPQPAQLYIYFPDGYVWHSQIIDVNIVKEHSWHSQIIDVNIVKEHSSVKHDGTDE